MGYSPWGRKESDTAEQLTLSLSCHPAKASGDQDSVDAFLSETHWGCILAVACVSSKGTEGGKGCEEIDWAPALEVGGVAGMGVGMTFTFRCERPGH